jgi:type II secretory pathway pseudopilin PulG
MKRTFTIIELLIVIALITIVAAISLPSLTNSRKAGFESAAIGNLRAIVSAQSIYRIRSLSGTYGSLVDLASQNYIPAEYTGGRRQGYFYEVTPDPTTPEYIYIATAAPASPGNTGDRYFFTNQSGVVRFSFSGAASSTDSPIGNQ